MVKHIVAKQNIITKHDKATKHGETIKHEKTTKHDKIAKHGGVAKHNETMKHDKIMKHGRAKNIKERGSGANLQLGLVLWKSGKLLCEAPIEGGVKRGVERLCHPN